MKLSSAKNIIQNTIQFEKQTESTSTVLSETFLVKSDNLRGLNFIEQRRYVKASSLR